MKFIAQKTCPVCGAPGKSFPVTDEQYKDFTEGTSHIQEIFPYLFPAERERFLTGICGRCWDKMFKEEED